MTTYSNNTLDRTYYRHSDKLDDPLKKFLEVLASLKMVSHHPIAQHRLQHTGSRLLVIQQQITPSTRSSGHLLLSDMACFLVSSATTQQ